MKLHAGVTPISQGPAHSRWNGLGIAIALCVAGLLAAGCSAAGDADGDDGAKKPPTSSAPTRPPTASPTPSSPPMSASPSPTYTATKDLHSCYDGKCTVEVKEGAVISFGGDVRLPDLSIDAVGPSGVDMRASGDGMLLQLSGQTPDQGGASKLNETAIAVLAITGDTTVLHIFPADEEAS